MTFFILDLKLISVIKALPDQLILIARTKVGSVLQLVAMHCAQRHAHQP